MPGRGVCDLQRICGCRGNTHGPSQAPGKRIYHTANSTQNSLTLNSDNTFSTQGLHNVGLGYCMVDILSCHWLLMGFLMGLEGNREELTYTADTL